MEVPLGRLWRRVTGVGTCSDEWSKTKKEKWNVAGMRVFFKKKLKGRKEKKETKKN